jgi:hypothetical protein
MIHHFYLNNLKVNLGLTYSLNYFHLHRLEGFLQLLGFKFNLSSKSSNNFKIIANISLIIGKDCNNEKTGNTVLNIIINSNNFINAIIVFKFFIKSSSLASL